MATKKVFFTVGPSQIYPTIPKHFKTALKQNIPSLYHRGQKFQNLYFKTTQNLRKLMNIPLSHHIFFLGSSLESMERIIENCVEKYSFHFINGSFSKKFYTIAKMLKRQPEKIEVPFGAGFDFSKVDIPKKTELICLTYNETSSGVALSLPEIYQLKLKYPSVLIALDIVSSAPYSKIDFSYIDMAFFSGQKCFGLPAGLGVLIVNKKAIAKAKKLAKKNINIGSYHNFLSFLEEDNKHQTPETPNVLDIYLLGKVCDDMLVKGIKKIRQEINKKADYVYNFFDRHYCYKPFVKNHVLRSKTTIVIDVLDKAEKIVKQLKKHGFIVSQGYKQYKNNHLRIANFPSHPFTKIKKITKIISNNKK